MKKAIVASPRPYRMGSRAVRAAETAGRILDAAHQQFAVEDFDAVALADLARLAGVTEQTVIRRFGSKDGVFAALIRRELPRIEFERRPAEGDRASLEQAVRTLLDHYAKDGAAMLNFLRQEQRYRAIADLAAEGRRTHEQWVRTYCRSVIGDPETPTGRRRLTAVVAATDLYIWKLLHVDRGMPRPEVEQVMLDLLNGIAAVEVE